MIPSQAKDYRRNKMRAWRWRQQHLTPEERQEYLSESRRIAAKRRWDTRGRLPPGEAERRHAARSLAYARKDPERRRAYMREYYRRKPWKWATSRANRNKYRGKTVRISGIDLKENNGRQFLADFNGRPMGMIA